MSLFKSLTFDPLAFLVDDVLPTLESVVDIPAIEIPVEAIIDVFPVIDSVVAIADDLVDDLAADAALISLPSLADIVPDLVSTLAPALPDWLADIVPDWLSGSDWLLDLVPGLPVVSAIADFFTHPPSLEGLYDTVVDIIDFVDGAIAFDYSGFVNDFFNDFFNYDSLAINSDNSLACRAYDQLIIFGDSLSDTGNLFAALGGLFPPPPYFQGRLSNGPIWVDEFAPDAGFCPEQVINFAVAGALSGRDNITETIAGVDLPIQLPGLLSQIDAFTTPLGGGGANPNALYVVWAGANDFLTLPDTVSEAVAAIVQSVDNVITAVTELAEVGAHTIAVGNSPNLGLTPLVNQEGTALEATAFSLAFNLLLQHTLADLEESLGIDVVHIDIFSQGQAAVQRPGDFGFTNFTDPLIRQTTPVDPNSFFFWDNFHPTAAVHEQIADLFLESLTVPTPSRVLATSLDLAVDTINSSGVRSLLETLLTDGLATLRSLPAQAPPLPATL
jgi:phospholipase/lecithinase/hemolysin